MNAVLDEYWQAYLWTEAVEEHFTLHCLLLSVEVKSGRTPFRARRRGRNRSSGH